MGCALAARTAGPADACADAGSSAIVCPRDFHPEYLLRGKLGEGAYGVVYAAVPACGVGEEVAVKIIDVRSRATAGESREGVMGDVDPRRAAAVGDEVARMKTLAGHDNVCLALDSYMHGGLAYIVLAMCDTTLFEALDHAPVLNEGALRPFFDGMLQGLSFVHRRGIIHRDVKPENFMCAGPGHTVKLCDFGLACVVSAETSAAVGTLAFMAPEVIQQRCYDTKVDAWSFGVLVYSIIFGCFPYMPEDATSVALRTAIATGWPAPSFPLRPGDISADMLMWVRMLLLRDSVVRPMCSEAVSHRWFRKRLTSSADFRVALHAAKRCGAFGDAHGAASHATSVDFNVRALQDRCRQQKPPEHKISMTTSDASTEAGSPVAGSKELD